MNDHAKSLLLKIGIITILVIFTFFAFFGKEGTDNFVTENLYEALHPFKWNDILGLILFYGGALFLAGFKPVMNPENSSKWNWITFGAIAAGIGLFLI